MFLLLLLCVIFNPWIEKKDWVIYVEKFLRDIISWRLKILREKKGEDE